MARSKKNGAELLGIQNERKSVAINITIKIPRRKLTLITITLLLNVLHWSSIVCIFIAIYQIASNPEDNTSRPSEILTLSSALATLLYTYFHTIISLKQRIWKHQQKHPSAIKKTSYAAIRLAVSLCVLWLLTCGWNMIIVARRPICLPEASGLQVWEVGSICRITRVGMAFAVISLIASFILFGILAVVRRPFEAHLYKHGYRSPGDPHASPSKSRETSPPRSSLPPPEKQLHGERRFFSTQRMQSNGSVSTIELSSSPSPPTIHAPSPQRSVGFGTFTSRFTPPPIPAAYIAPPRSSSLEPLPPIFQPSISHQPISRPPRLSGFISTSGFAPLSIAPQYAASTWRAVHPSSPSSMRPALRSHSNPVNSGMSYRTCYSRSSASLTRPRRLSTATPAGSVTWSSRSGSEGGEGRRTPSSSDETGDRKASADEIAFAILNGTTIPGTTRSKTRGKRHMRTSSAPDATCGAQEPLQMDRMAIGWKPELAGQAQELVEEHSPQISSMPAKLSKLVRSSSAELLSRFSPDSSPDNDEKTPWRELERNIDLRMRVMKELPFGRVNSIHPAVTGNASGDAVASGAAGSNAPQELRVSKTRILHSEFGNKRRTYDEVKNKPLPKIEVF
ncbi:hypothetical protein GQ44DRAFT_603304 [Phaeosphaeriaceae sp. PMI808]|nr:hypothetical protein GQ44DRAFT_603304 [Phaeosphaeriaceae sp. PMI808]